MIVIPAKMGQLNKRALLTCLQQLGTASRAELAKALELSQPTVGKIADELMRQGIVEEITGSLATGSKSIERVKAGRPGRVLSMNRSRPRFLGVHLDVRETRFALLPVQPSPVDEWDLILPTASGNHDWLAPFREAKQLLDTDDLLGVILCVPGIVDEGAGRVLFSPNLHWTEKASLPALLHEIWPIPIVMIQELRALAMGYKTFDAGGEDFLAVDFGEGVGSSAIVGGRLYANPLPMSGELGHTPVQGNARACGCGAIGCLETLISRRGLLQSFASAEGRAALTVEDLKRQILDQGIPSWLSETIELTGSIIAGALNVMGLRKVVVSGVFSELPTSVHEQFTTAITSGALWERFGRITCVFGPRHHTAGMVAAGLDRLVMPSNPGMPVAHLPAAAQNMTG